MEVNATRICELLVGLHDVTVLGVEDVPDRPVRVHVESRLDQGWCRACGCRARVKDRDPVQLVDLPCFGRRVELVWRKVRWCCVEPACEAGSWTIIDDRIAPSRAVLTDRAARWATRQVGLRGRTVREVADELGCDWHTVNDAVVAYGEALLDADEERVGPVDALGLDETLFCRRGPRHLKEWCTSIVDVGGPDRPAKLIDIVAGRSAAGACEWLDDQPQVWRGQIRYGVLDLSGPYRKVFDDALDHVTQIADPFHVIKHANAKLDECRRRVQNETLGHRGRKDDPLYRARRLLTKAHERLDESGDAKLAGLLEAGDPRGEVRMAWHAKEVIRSIYDLDDPDLARTFVDELADDLQDDSCPPEVHSLGRTLRRWLDHIVAWHEARATNGPTEAMNNLIKRIKRIGFGFRRLRHYRVRALLYAGRPNWDLLATITPPLKSDEPLLLTGGERLDETGRDRMLLGLRVGDSGDEVLGAWLAKESVRDVYLASSWRDARVLLTTAIRGCVADEVPEIQSLGATLQRWQREILARHTTGASNGPTEGLNLLVKKVKRCGHGHRNFEHYRLRVLLHAGGVTWPARPRPPQIRTRAPHPNA